MMLDSHIFHDRIIARVQHFADKLEQIELEKQSLFMIFDNEKSIEKEKIKEQIITLKEMLSEYYSLFEDILYR